MKTWLNGSVIFIVTLVMLSFVEKSYAGKIDMLTGTYSVTAKTLDRTGSASGLGAYKLSYSFDFIQNVELTVGYTLMMSQIIGGDLGYGFDFEMNYFPFTSTAPIFAQTEESLLKVSPLWRPYVGLTFHQRQFQSVELNYAGFGVNLGFERDLEYEFDLKGLLRYSVLGGPNSATASEVIILLGISFPFSIK